MGNADLSGTWRKICRAENHFRDINTAVKAALTPKDPTNNIAPYEFQEDRKHLIVRSPKPEPISESLPLAIGDCVHNLRSALDHLAFQLAVVNGKAAEAETKIAFPIYLTDAEFWNFSKKRVAPFIDAEALTEIENLQPYKTGNGGEGNLLWVLHQLDIIDKHRLIVVIARQMRPTSFTVEVPTGETFAHTLAESQWTPMEDGTEILRVDLSEVIQTPGRVHVEIQYASMVYVKETGLFCDGNEIQGLLQQCHDFVRQVVEGFEVEFFR
jgi:hypothetical protein